MEERDQAKQEVLRAGDAVRGAFQVFAKRVQHILESKAEDKGYRIGEDPRPGGSLYSFVEAHFGKGNHPMGEVVYKIVRAHETGKLEDLEKAAAWLFLVWARSDTRAKEEAQYGQMQRAAVGLAEERAGATGPMGTRTATDRPVGGLDFPNISIGTTLQGVEHEARLRLTERPQVRFADLVRLAALAGEEAGEALKAALDATREPLGGIPSLVSIQLIVQELVQTAAMATISAAVIQERIDQQRSAKSAR